MNNNDVLKQAKDALDLAIKGEQRNKSFMTAIGPAIADALKGALGSQILETMKPFFSKLAEDNAKTNENLTKAIQGLNVNINPEVRIPDIKIPEIKIPTVNVPRPEVTVNVPEIKIPKIEIPATQFPELMKVMMEGIDRTHPLPVLVVDEMGNPFYGGGGGSMSSGGRVVTDITDVRSVSLIDSTTNPAQPTLRTSAVVTFPTSSLSVAVTDSSGVQYSGSNPFPVIITSGAASTTATNIVDSTGVAYSGSNPFPTTASLSVAVGQGDSASALRTIQAGDSVSSINVLTINGTTPTLLALAQGDSASALRTIQAGDSVSSVIVNSGTITTVTGITNTVMIVGDIASGSVEDGSSFPIKVGARFNTTIPTYTDGQRGDVQMGSRGSLNVTMMAVGSGNALRSNDDNTDTVAPTATTDKLTVMARNTLYDSIGNTHSRQVGGAGVTNVGTMRTVIATDSVASVVVNSGTLTTVTTVTGVTNSLQTAIIDSSGVQYSGSNPMSVNVTGQNDSMLTWLSHTTLPTAKADGSDVRPLSDKYGRQINRPIQVRDLLATAYVSLTSGVEATLLAASAGALYDLVWVQMSNQSTAAVQVDIRPVLAGNILMTFQIPGNGTVGIAPPVPLPGGSDTGNAWTVDMPDITGTTVNITGLFTREI